MTIFHLGVPREVHESPVPETALHLASQGTQVPDSEVRGPGAIGTQHGDKQCGHTANRVPTKR